MSVTGLVLFIGFNVILAIMEPMNLLMGWIVKIIVLVGLVKAIQSAIAYQREQQAAVGGEQLHG
jgi:hypothetical protein